MLDALNVELTENEECIKNMWDDRITAALTDQNRKAKLQNTFIYYCGIFHKLTVVFKAAPASLTVNASITSFIVLYTRVNNYRHGALSIKVCNVYVLVLWD